ncbi:hypothetical protein ACFL6G_04090 [candidate division KSB1 bacterium]
MTKTKEIRFRVTRIQYERIKQNAEYKGRSISQYMRDISFNYDLIIIQRISEIHTMLKEIQAALIK